MPKNKAAMYYLSMFIYSKFGVSSSMILCGAKVARWTSTVIYEANP
jgi:hypothetical protein